MSEFVPDFSEKQTSQLWQKTISRDEITLLDNQKINAFWYVWTRAHVTAKQPLWWRFYIKQSEIDPKICDILTTTEGSNIAEIPQYPQKPHPVLGLIDRYDIRDGDNCSESVMLDQKRRVLYFGDKKIWWIEDNWSYWTNIVILNSSGERKEHYLYKPAIDERGRVFESESPTERKVRETWGKIDFVLSWENIEDIEKDPQLKILIIGKLAEFQRQITETLDVLKD